MQTNPFKIFIRSMGFSFSFDLDVNIFHICSEADGKIGREFKSAKIGDEESHKIL